MTRPLALRYIVAILCLPFLAGCSKRIDPQKDPSEEVESPVSTTAQERKQSPDESKLVLDESAMCPRTQWIARGRQSAGDTCKSVRGWTAAPLLPPIPKEQLNNSKRARSARFQFEQLLGPYCTYEWSSADAPKLDEFTTSFDEVYSNCRLTPATSTGSFSYELVQLEQSFFANVGLTKTCRQSGDRCQLRGEGVKIAVLDSAQGASQGGFDYETVHGPAMISIIEKIAPGAIIDAREVDSVADVMGAIATVFESDSKLVDDSTPVIINLSLGWEANNSNPLVQDAIRIARCEGALVFAAVGNTHPGACKASGALYPAAWESEPTSCPVSYPAQPDALVRAVSAVDASGELLPTNRSDSTLAALGHLAAINLKEYSDPSTVFYGPFSGSSISTAVTSAVAALIWSDEPMLDATGVIDQMMPSPPPASGVTVISACTAGPCDDQLSEPPSPSFDQAVGSPDTAPLVISAAALPEVQVVCPSPALGLQPAPSDPPCKKCGLQVPSAAGPAQLHLELNEPYIGPTTSVELHVRTSSGGEFTKSYAIGVTATLTILEDSAIPLDADYAYVTLIWPTSAAGNEIPVVPPPS